MKVIYVTYHWGKSGACHCPKFSDAKVILCPWKETSSLSLRSRSVVSIGLSFPHTPHAMSTTLSLTLMTSSLVELKDNWTVEGLLMLTVLSETSTLTLFWEKVVWVIAFPFICEHRREHFILINVFLRLNKINVIHLSRHLPRHHACRWLWSSSH